MNRKENIMGNEKMTLIYINRDIYSYMLPNKENRLVSAADLLDAWGRAIRRPGELWFDIEKAERDFVRKVFDILAPACATPLKGSGLNVSVIGMTSDDDKKRLLMTLIERVKSIDMARFLEAYRDDGWVYDSENGVAYGPYQWNGLVGAMVRDCPFFDYDGPLFMTRQSFFDAVADQYKSLNGKPWKPVLTTDWLTPWSTGRKAEDAD